jgi:ribonuclease E
MSQKILIDGSSETQTQFALLSDNGLEDFEFESISKKNLKGNIYLGKVSRIEASLQAAFVDIGSEKNGFLAFGEIHPNYFQIPVADREALIQAEAEIEEDYNVEDEKYDSEVRENDGANEADITDIKNVDETVGDIEEESKNNEIENKVLKRKKTHALRRRLYRSYKIQEVIKTGQLILVQVVKEERGNKGAALTAYISLAGKYSVLMPNSTKTIGVSRKISISDDRKKLKKIIEELKVPPEMGLIIRTAGLNRTKNEIKKDYATLNKLWVQIVSDTKKAIAPALIHEEGNLLRRVVRDIYSKEMKEILVQGKDAYKETKKYMSQVLPGSSKFVKLYKNKEPLFVKHNVEKEIIKMFDAEVKLKSGGYLVINPTEALVAIDVNSGGATKERNIEKTALKTNLEAAIEIAKQIKIRDLSGLIVIDFIDMYEMRNNRQVERKIKELVKKDRARTQVSRISQFGLLEMSRQRLRQSFIEWKTELSHSSIVQRFLYQINEELNKNKIKKLGLKINPYIKNLILTNFQKEISDIELSKGVTIYLVDDNQLKNSEIVFETDESNKKKKTDNKKSKAKKGIANSVKKKTIKEKVKVKEKNIEKDKNENSFKAKNKNPKPVLKEIKDKKTGWWQK